MLTRRPEGVRQLAYLFSEHRLTPVMFIVTLFLTVSYRPYVPRSLLPLLHRCKKFRFPVRLIPAGRTSPRQATHCFRHRAGHSVVPWVRFFLAFNYFCRHRVLYYVTPYSSKLTLLPCSFYPKTSRHSICNVRAYALPLAVLRNGLSCISRNTQSSMYGSERNGTKC